MVTEMHIVKYICVWQAERHWSYDRDLRVKRLVSLYLRNGNSLGTFCNFIFWKTFKMFGRGLGVNWKLKNLVR